MIGNQAAWEAETTPANLRAVGQALVDGIKEITWSHIGFKGDDSHDGGYHRSLRWNYATMGRGVDYSDKLSRDTSQRDTAKRNFIRAIDVSDTTSNRRILIPMCQRLDKAVRAGLLEADVREWYGNDDGDNRVDGYDNFYNVVSSSDSSHLWHLHISFYTDAVDLKHDKLIAVLLGEEDMPLTDAEIDKIATAVWRKDIIPAPSGAVANPDFGPPANNTTWGAQNAMHDAVQVGRENAAKLANQGTVSLTADQIRAIVREELNKTKLGE